MANEFIARKGLIVSGSTVVTNAVTASFFRGDGSNLTNITATSASFSTTASFASTANNLNGGTANYIPLWTSATAQSSSAIFQTNGNVLIGLTTALGFPGRQLTVKSGQSYGGVYTDGTITSFFNTWDTTAIPLTFVLGGSELVRITPAGDVGIGTSSPGAKLHVQGAFSSSTVTTTGNVVVGGQLSGVTDSTGLFGVRVRARAVDDTFSVLDFSNNAGTTRYATIVASSNSDLRFSTGSGEAMRIDSSGRVGMGTVSPATKLHVAGGATANQISVGSNTAGETGAIYLYGTSTKYNWSVGAQQTVDNGFEITPSTATGGVSFTSPAFVISGVTRNIGINTSSPNSRLTVNGNANITGSLDVTGAFTAQTKSFKINHQTIPNRSLVYGVLEGPEHAVYVRGRLTDENTIHLPTEWEWLIDENSITVQLTPIGSHQKLYVDSVSNKQIVVKVDTLFDRRIDCYYLVHATRKDVEPLQTVQ